MKRLLEFWRLLNLPCEDMTALMSRALDTELPFRERFAYKLHLLYCRACRRYLRQVRLLREQLRRIRDALTETAPDALSEGTPAAPRLSPAARARIDQTLRDD